jgi:hypothetical protein
VEKMHSFKVKVDVPVLLTNKSKEFSTTAVTAMQKLQVPPKGVQYVVIYPSSRMVHDSISIWM